MQQDGRSRFWESNHPTVRLLVLRCGQEEEEQEVNDEEGGAGNLVAGPGDTPQKSHPGSAGGAYAR